MELVRMPLDLAMTAGEVLRALRDDRLPFALTGRWAGSRAVLGSDPVRIVRGAAALEVLDLPPLDGPDGAVGGGWFGFLGFALGSAIERLPPAPPRPAPMPAAMLGFYDHVLRLDAAGRWWFEALSEEAAERRLDVLTERLRRPAGARPWSVEGMALHGAGADGHRAAVAECVERIAAGELFQANVCLRLDGRFAGSAADAYAAAAERLGPARGAFLGLDEGAVLSFSPELFLRRRGRTVETAPIKGTAPRSAVDAEAAATARARLAGSAKDAAEHVMIVDLMRNDLGRVAAYGTVRAAEAPDVEAHPGLWHLVSRVSGELRDGVGDADVVRATFPPGSVTGAPKVQALKVISELEGTAREVYTGAIGFASPVAGLELSVAIRTLEVSGDRAWLGCGGGVVADSHPDAELHEALDKARPVVEALGARVPTVPTRRAEAASAARPTRPMRRIRRPDPAAGLLETIAVRDGRAIAADRHLRRLAAGAAEVLGVEVPDDLARRVRAAAASAGRGSARLRLVVRAGEAAGAVELTVAPAPDAPADVALEPVLIAGGLGAHKWADRTPLDGLEAPGRAALLCDLDGGVLEAGSASVWVIEGDRLLTPPADGRILPGVTRERLLDCGVVDGLRAVEAPLDLDLLARADGLLVTSAIRVAAPASLPGETPSPAARHLAAAVRARLAPRLASTPTGPVAQLVRAADS